MTDDIVTRMVRLSAFFAMGFVVRPLSVSRLLLLVVLLGVIAYTWETDDD